MPIHGLFRGFCLSELFFVGIWFTSFVWVFGF